MCGRLCGCKKLENGSLDYLSHMPRRVGEVWQGRTSHSDEVVLGSWLRGGSLGSREAKGEA
jgi:hypothetical protein